MASMSKKLKREIGLRLGQIREELKLSKKEMAARLCVSPATYFRNESGKTDPAADTLFTLAADMNISLNWLIGGQGEMFNHTPEESREILEFLTLMKKIPLLNHAILEHFCQFKRDNPDLVREAQEEQNARQT